MKAPWLPSWPGLVTAMRTLTVLPWPGRDAAAPAAALSWFPLVGAILGSLVVLLLKALGQGLLWPGGGALWPGGGVLWPGGGAALALALSTVLTGGLHFDGLADAVDGWRGGRTPEQRLAIMKDARIGALGALALGLVLLLQFVAFLRMVNSPLLTWVILPFVLARLAQVQLAVSLPYARPAGGTAQAFVAGAQTGHFLAALLWATFFCGLIAGRLGFTLLLLSLAVTQLLRPWLRSTFGGVTGDVLGAVSSVLETAWLLLLALLAPYVALLQYLHHQLR